MKRTICALVLVLAAHAAAPQMRMNTPTVPIPPTFFGMHIHRVTTKTPWPPIPFHSWRVWDARVCWYDVEPSRGVFNFDLLDKYVELAEQHDVEVLLMLGGGTPTWASARPNEFGRKDVPMGVSAEPADLRDWDEYVSTVAKRYKGRIRNYEVWNEPDSHTYYTGSVRQMVVIAQHVHDIIKSIDPSARIVSPSTTILAFQWLNQFLDQGGGRYIDVVGYHFYLNVGPPEDYLKYIPKVRQIMNAHGLQQMQLWTTESGWGGAKTFSSVDEQSAYVSRALILNWASGVSRYFWYSYDNTNWSTLRMFNAQTSEPTPVAAAYTETEKWLIDATMQSCDSNNGVWLCAMSRGESRYWIVWYTGEGQRSWKLPPGTRISSVTDLDGKVTPVDGNSIVVEQRPIMIQ